MTNLPESNEIVTVTPAAVDIGLIEYIDDVAGMDYNDILIAKSDGAIPDDVLLRRALRLLADAEARYERLVDVALSIRDRVDDLNK